MMQWWLEKGIDGFRMDVINLIAKPEGLPDSTLMGKGYKGRVFDSALYANNEKCHTYLKEMNKQVLSKYDIMTVGETPNVTPDTALKYVDVKRKELDMVFSFEHVEYDGAAVPEGKLKVLGFLIKEGIKLALKGNRKFNVPKYKNIVKNWYTVIEKGGWNSQYFSNHDQPRQASKFGDDKNYHDRSAKMLATLIHTLPGTPYVYQGEEIGMTNIALPEINDYRDVATINAYKKAVNAGIPKKFAMSAVHDQSRDNARTPMQWSDEENAGFSKGSPWSAVNPNYKNINVKSQLENQNSIYYYYKKLIELRKQNEIMVYGTFEMVDEKNKKVIAYIREYENKRWFVAINLTGSNAIVKPDADINFNGGKVILSNMNKEIKENAGKIKMQPFEALILEI